MDGPGRRTRDAFLLEPTIAARLDLDETQALLDEMLAANVPYLPLFQ